MTSWAATVSRIADNGFGESRNGNTVDGAIIHHVAGTNGFSYVANWNDRDSHPTYHVNSDGVVSGIVHPDRRPWSTGHGVDERCVTFEIDNVTAGGDWPVSDAALWAVINTIADHARQAGKQWAALNVRGQEQPEFFIGWHQQYGATACPGPYVIARLQWIVDRVNEVLNPPVPPPPPVIPAAPVWYDFTPEREMRVIAAVDIVDIVTGKKQGNTLQPGQKVIISSDATTGDGVHYFRSKYSEIKAFNWGMLATAFSDVPAPEPPGPAEPSEPETPDKPTTPTEPDVPTPPEPTVPNPELERAIAYQKALARVAAAQARLALATGADVRAAVQAQLDAALADLAALSPIPLDAVTEENEKAVAQSLDALVAGQVPSGEMVTKLIRTFVPYLWGWIVTSLIGGIPALAPVVAQIPENVWVWVYAISTILLGAGWYALGTWLGKALPGKAGQIVERIMIGSSKRPVYVQPAKA